MRKCLFILSFVFPLFFAGCKFIEVTPEAEKVRVLEANEVTQCKRLGKTTVSVLAKTGIIERKGEKVEKELADLARNSAAEMGGDTIVPMTGIQDGKRTFAVYRCINP